LEIPCPWELPPDDDDVLLEPAELALLAPEVTALLGPEVAVLAEASVRRKALRKKESRTLFTISTSLARRKSK